MNLAMNSKALKIAEPCHADWKKMTPADGGRFCGDCKKVVKNISSMTEKNARKLLRAAGDGQLCIRYLHDKLGNVVFGANQPRPDFVPVSMLSRAKRVVAFAGLAVASQACSAISDASDSLSSSLEAQPRPSSDDDDDTTPSDQWNTGGVAYDPSMDHVIADGDAGADASPSDQDGGAANADATADQDGGAANVPN